GVARLGTIVAWTKGAPDVVLERCRFLLSPGGVRPLADADRSRIAEANQLLAAQALRVLAVAWRGWPGVPGPLDAEAAEQELIFVGLVGMIDPPRPEAAESIRRRSALASAPSWSPATTGPPPPRSPLAWAWWSQVNKCRWSPAGSWTRWTTRPSRKRFARSPSSPG